MAARRSLGLSDKHRGRNNEPCLRAPDFGQVCLFQSLHRVRHARFNAKIYVNLNVRIRFISKQSSPNQGNVRFETASGSYSGPILEPRGALSALTQSGTFSKAEFRCKKGDVLTAEAV